jgi:uridine monophosphate synthetase
MPLSKIQIIKKLYLAGIFTLDDIVLKSGKKSPYYCDFRLLISKPELYQEVVEFICAYLETLSFEYQHLGSVPIGSLPFTTSVSNRLNQSFVIPRGETKTYGKKCSIEGSLHVGDTVLVLEDVITTGASVLEAVEIIKNNGGVVKDVVCIFDREEEGEPVIKGNDINFHSVFSLSDLIRVLESEQMTDNLHLEKLKFHNEKYKKIQVDLHIENTEEFKRNERKEKLTRNYQELVENSFNKRLLNIIKTKQTSVCLSLDTGSWNKGKSILESCAPYICMVKLHLDLLTDWNDTATQEILDISKTHNFLILEDSKLDDVPNIVENQVYGGLYSFGNWVDAVTVNSVNFVPINNSLYRSSRKKRFDNVSKELTCIPVGQYNTKDSMVTKDYSVNFRNKLLEEKDARFQTRTIIQQNLFKTDNQFLRITPGVIEVDEDIIFNEDRDRYRSIESAMMRDRNHVVIIGGNIIINENVVEKCKSCAAKTWENMNLYYKKILDLIG